MGRLTWQPIAALVHALRINGSSLEHPQSERFHSQVNPASSISSQWRALRGR